MKTTEFIKLAKKRICYNPGAKKDFHLWSEYYLRLIADKLGLRPGEYKLGHCNGGDAVSGEIILHSDKLYVQFYQGTETNSFLWRKCNGMSDYTGETNQWMRWDSLKNIDSVVKTMAKHVGHEIQIIPKFPPRRMASAMMLHALALGV